MKQEVTRSDTEGLGALEEQLKRVREQFEAAAREYLEAFEAERALNEPGVTTGTRAARKRLEDAADQFGIIIPEYDALKERIQRRKSEEGPPVDDHDW